MLSMSAQKKLNVLRVAHMSDLHYANETLKEVDKCFGHSIDKAIEANVDVAVISGDATDHKLDMHSPAVIALANQIRRLSDHCPVLMLQGTFSHEPPGTLDIFRLVGGKYPVFVADRLCQVALTNNQWVVSENWCFDEAFPFISSSSIVSGIDGVFTCIPTINKALVAAAVGVKSAAEAVGDHISALLAGYGISNAKARASSIPTILVSHGTVSGCLTEHGVPMDGLDHEFTTGTLFAAKASAVMIGHIHAHQYWDNDGRKIAYPGSIGRLHHGEIDPKGFLVWEVFAEKSEFDFVHTPARRMIDLEFQGLPDMDAIKLAAADVDGAFVRVRWSVDEEHRNAVDRKAIEALLDGAAKVQMEGRILPVVRTRAEGMNKETTLLGKLMKWSQVTGTDSSGLDVRLESLLSSDPEKIVDEILAY